MPKFEIDRRLSDSRAKELAKADILENPALAEGFWEPAGAIAYRACERQGRVKDPRNLQANVSQPAPTPAAGKTIPAPPIKPNAAEGRAALKAWAGATADWEIAHTPAVQRGFSSSANYKFFRVAELTGAYKPLNR